MRAFESLGAGECCNNPRRHLVTKVCSWSRVRHLKCVAWRVLTPSQAFGLAAYVGDLSVGSRREPTRPKDAWGAVRLRPTRRPRVGQGVAEGPGVAVDVCGVYLSLVFTLEQLPVPMAHDRHQQGCGGSTASKQRTEEATDELATEGAADSPCNAFD